MPRLRAVARRGHRGHRSARPPAHVLDIGAATAGKHRVAGQCLVYARLHDAATAATGRPGRRPTYWTLGRQPPVNTALRGNASFTRGCTTRPPRPPVGQA